MALSLVDLLQVGSDGGWTGNSNLYKYMQGEEGFVLFLGLICNWKWKWIVWLVYPHSPFPSSL